MPSPILKQLLLGTQSSSEEFLTEISAHVDAFSASGAHYLVSIGGGSRLTVTSFGDLPNASVVETAELNQIPGGFTAQSVDVYGDLVAVAVQPTGQSTANGAVQFWRMADDGSLTFLTMHTVGVLPDSLKFTGNGRQLVVANEGQPSADYSQDPAGSISILDIDYSSSELVRRHTLLDFTAFTAPVKGIVDGSQPRFSNSIPNGSLYANDLEPEAISINGKYAYVTLQEANAVAKVNIATRTIESIHALGAVDFTKQYVDLTDNGSASPAYMNRLNGATILGLRMPDGLDSYRWRGQTYLVTANEGDTRTDYGSIYYDEFRPNSSLSPDVYTIRDGLADGSESYRTNGVGTNTAFGSRSISIHNEDGTVVWDSGNQLQSSAIASGLYDDSRSDTKGVEPEMVTVGVVDGRRYAFVGTERTTATMISAFDITNPNKAHFVTSIKINGSRSPEGLLFIDAASSPTGEELLVISNEVSNTLDFVNAAELVSQDAYRNVSGSFESSMFAEAVGGPDLSFKPLLTIGEVTPNKYLAPGILDGLGAFNNHNGTFTVLASHELSMFAGYGYTLPAFDSGEELHGARISRFVVRKDADNDSTNGYQPEIIKGELAYNEIIDANGDVVTVADQLNGGLNRFCSSSYLAKNSFGSGRGFSDAIYLAGEESDEGLFYALDVHDRRLHAVPALGRAGWENATLIDTGSRDTVALFLADDNTAAPLMWVGTKARGNSDFLRRNGLDVSSGNLYTWTPTGGSIGTAAGDPTLADSADLNAASLGTPLSGEWVLVGSGSDVASWDEFSLKSAVKAPGGDPTKAGLQLSRLEDVDVNPLNGRQLVLATTGNSDFGGADRYGNMMVFDFATTFGANGLVGSGQSSLRLIYDGDRLGGLARQDGIRNPDNLAWSADGNIYVQEDRSVPGGTADGQFGVIEASVWTLNPSDPITSPAGVTAQRFAVLDPTNGVPTLYGQTNANPPTTASNVGNWESSGIIDVSSIYGLTPGSMMLADVQAHSLRDGNIGGFSNLIEGGQLTLIARGSSIFG
jgi:hypothetical protein